MDDRARWNRRHAARDSANDEPLAVLRDRVAALPGGTALDVACGRGRHALLLARHGFDVLAVDVSDVALAEVRRRAAEAGVRVRTERRDVSREGLPPVTFDLVVVTYFLDRALFPALRDAVRPGGTLVYETFTMLNAERTGFSRRWCLEDGELLRAFPGFDVVDYRESRDGEIATLVARRKGAEGEPPHDQRVEER